MLISRPVQAVMIGIVSAASFPSVLLKGKFRRSKYWSIAFSRAFGSAILLADFTIDLTLYP